MPAVANEIDAFGESYFANCITPIEAVLTTKDVYYQITGLTVNNNFNITVGTGSFTILYDGKYKFAGVATIFPSAGCNIRFSLFINGVAQPNICTALSFQNNQDKNTFSGNGFLDLVTGDIVTVKATADTNLITLDIPNINLNLMRVGL